MTQTAPITRQLLIHPGQAAGMRMPPFFTLATSRPEQMP
jgi:hypothetical protein